MATSVFYPSSNGFVVSAASSSNYAAARAGTEYTEFYAHDDNTLWVQQSKDGSSYALLVALLRFDTSSLPDTDEVSSPVLSLFPHASTPVFGSPGDLEVYPAAFGASLGTEDWVPGANISGMTKLASIAAASFTSGAYRALTSEAAFAAAISKTGYTDILLVTSLFRLGTAPTGVDGFRFSSMEASSSYRPKLTVEHSAAPPAYNMHLHNLLHMGG